jgi:hypothetical protein
VVGGLVLSGSEYQLEVVGIVIFESSSDARFLVAG